MLVQRLPCLACAQRHWGRCPCLPERCRQPGYWLFGWRHPPGSTRDAGVRAGVRGRTSVYNKVVVVKNAVFACVCVCMRAYATGMQSTCEQMMLGYSTCHTAQERHLRCCLDRSLHTWWPEQSGLLQCQAGQLHGWGCLA